MATSMISNYFRNIFSTNNTRTISSELSLIYKLLKSNFLTDFVDKYSNLITDKQGQYFTSLGINFKDGKIESVKLYAHVLEDLSKEEIERFLPISDDYFKHLFYKRKGTDLNNHNVGTILEIKFKMGFNTPSYGFFYILQDVKEGFEKVGQPRFLPQEIIDNCINVGVNYEYHVDSKLQKYKTYYYFNASGDKKYFEDRIGKNLPGNFVEYAEGEGFSKINSYSGIVTDFWEKDQIFNLNERKIIKKLVKRHNLKIIGSGTYEDNSIRAVYFRQAISQNASISNMLIEQNSDVLKSF
jgi:hypothetical protein